MIDVRGFRDPSTEPDLHRGDRQSQGQDLQNRNELRGDLARNRLGHSGPTERELRDRAAAFNRALGAKSKDTAPDTESSKEKVPLFVMEGATTPFSLLSHGASQSKIDSAQSEFSARVASRIDTALAAIAREPTTATTNVQVPVGSDGLSRVLLTINATGIDITLVHEAGAQSLSTPDMARDLAERLQLRLGRRRVRVFEESLPTHSTTIPDRLYAPSREDTV